MTKEDKKLNQEINNEIFGNMSFVEYTIFGMMIISFILLVLKILKDNFGWI